MGLDTSDLGVGGRETSLEHGLPLAFSDLVAVVGAGVLLGGPLLLVQSLIGVVDDSGTLGHVVKIVLVPGHAKHLATERECGDSGVADHCDVRVRECGDVMKRRWKVIMGLFSVSSNPPWVVRLNECTEG